MLCREEAFDLVTALKNKQLSGYNLIGIIKEVAPCSTAKTDAELGVDEFQKKYFNNQPLYLDSELNFYKYLGNNGKLRTLTSLPFSWNPFTIFKSFKAISERISKKGLEGNYRGEGFNLGGVIVYTPKKGIIYEYKEITGNELPMDEIILACKNTK